MPPVFSDRLQTQSPGHERDIFLVARKSGILQGSQKEVVDGLHGYLV